MKKAKVVPQVSVKVRAIDQGYYQNRIIKIGEEFIYKGGLNRKGGLPLWVEALEEVKLPKVNEEKKEEKVVEPKAPAATKLPKLAAAPKKAAAKKGKPSLADSVA